MAVNLLIPAQSYPIPGKPSYDLHDHEVHLAIVGPFGCGQCRTLFEGTI